MMNLEDLTILSWLRLFGALFLFMGSGTALYTFYPSYNRGVFCRYLTYSLLFSIGIWVSILTWFQWLNLKIGFWFALILSLAGWAVAIYRLRHWILGRMSRLHLQIDLGQLLQVIIAITAFFFALWNSRHMVTGLGSDSYHHTLIAQMIADQGKIPTNYLPIAPIVSFSYHFGYHAVIAFVSWFSDAPMRLLVVFSGPVLLAISALSLGWLTQKLTGSSYAGAFAAAVPGIMFQFPIFMLNWGRYTQFAGLTLLPVLLALFIDWFKDDLPLIYIPLIGLGSVALALVHYRVTLMATVALAIMAVFFWFTTWKAVISPYKLAARIGLAVVFALVLSGPWLLRVITNRQLGYAVNFPPAGPSYFVFARAGYDLNTYKLSILTLVLTGFATALGLFTKEKIIYFLLGWTGILVILSRPVFSGTIMDSVSVVISLFIPAAVAVGWFVWRVIDRIASGKVMVTAIISILIIGFISLWSGTEYQRLFKPEYGFVTESDMKAMMWIQKNTPTDAVFLVNTLHFDFNDKYIIGSDAGYWLPVLANRKTITLPMTYPSERMLSSDVIPQLLSIDQLNRNFQSDLSLSIIQKSDAGYVFIGNRSDPAQIGILSQDPHYKNIYASQTTAVFQILYQ